MKKRVKIILVVLGIIAILLILNEFILISIGTSSSSAASCMQQSLSRGVNNSELIIIGKSVRSKWVTQDSGMIKTHTTLQVDSVIVGNYDNDEITISQTGGCNKRRNMCMRTSVEFKLYEESTYLLFLSDKDNDGIYEGFSLCGGVYLIDTDEIRSIHCFNAEEVKDLCINEENQIPLLKLIEKINELSV